MPYNLYTSYDSYKKIDCCPRVINVQVYDFIMGLYGVKQLHKIVRIMQRNEIHKSRIPNIFFTLLMKSCGCGGFMKLVPVSQTAINILHTRVTLTRKIFPTPAGRLLHSRGEANIKLF